MKNRLHSLKGSNILLAFVISGITITQFSCQSNSSAATPAPVSPASDAKVEKTDSVRKETATSTVIADAATVLKRTEVPILCYHQLRNWQPSDSRTARAYIVPEKAFAEQMKALADSGYHTILPDQLMDYLQKGSPLPSKPVMLTFDDTRLDQYTVGLTEMNKYGFKGVFFIMTVSLGRPGYMSADQVKQLSDAGHTIGSHTWDHHNVKKYQGQDWETQIEKPSKQLEQITGKPIDYFAYPFGLWNHEAIPQLQERGFKASFQLSENRDKEFPLFTIRRIIVPGSWSGTSMVNAMTHSFGDSGK